MSGAENATHPNGIWRDRANFLIMVDLEGTDRNEQLWARKVSEFTFEVCCIPFYADDIALGDLVETDSRYYVRRVIEPSGRYVFRAWFGEAANPDPLPVVEELDRMGALVEIYSGVFISIDARDLAHAEAVSGFLLSEENAGRLMYETGRR